MLYVLSMLMLVVAAPKAKAPVERCTNLLECELSCPEVSVQGQRKSPTGQEITFCDPVGEEVHWHNERTRASQGERFGEQRTGKWRFWHPNGRLASQQHFADTGAPDGQQKFWYPNGTKQRHAQYSDGILDGDYATWHVNGKRSETRTYKQGSLTGEIKQWHANGRISAFGKVDGQKIHWERYFNTGKIGLKGSVEATGDVLDLGDNVQPTGAWSIFSPSGKVTVKMQFRSGRASGTYKRFFANGKPMMVMPYKDGKPSGVHQHYHANHQLKQSQEFAKRGRGKPHGLFNRYYPSGLEQEAGTYRNGKKDGVWKTFHRNGLVAEVDDHRSAPVRRISYDRDGAKIAQGALKKGLKHGPWTHFDSFETKRSAGSYDRGVRTGLWRFWGQDGKPLAKGEFDTNGRRVGAWRYDHPGGGKWFLIKALKATTKGGEERYLLRGRGISACDKMAQDGICEGLSVFDTSDRLRVRVTLPASWQADAAKACRSSRGRNEDFCDQDHGDLLHAMDGLAKLISRRRLQRKADCWSAGGEPEKCPLLNRSLLPFQAEGSLESRIKNQGKLPFSSCSDAKSCSEECKTWANANDPFATIFKATRSRNELRCARSGPFVTFHRPRVRLASALGARALPHRQALKSEYHGLWTGFHPNGVVAAKGTFDKGTKEGLWTRWHANGTKASETTFRAGLEVGAAKSWHDSGKLDAMGSYRSGIRVGKWRFFDHSGQPMSKGGFSAGKRHGPWLLYDANGKPESKGRYQTGRLVGRWTYFDDRGRKKALCTWTPQDDADRRDCSRTNGIPISKGLIKDNLEEGLWTFFHRNGQKRSEGKMRSGARVGVWRMWHNSGRKQSKGRYAKGQKSSGWKCWNNQGRAVKCKKPD